MKPVEIVNIVIQALILLTVGATVVVYHRQLKAMQTQLQAALWTSTRALHSDLLKLAMSDKDVLEVWRADHADLAPEDFKRHLFVNLHLSHVEALFQLDRLNLEQVGAELAHHSRNPYYRAFWANARQHRREMPGTAGDPSLQFQALCDKAFGAE